MSRSGEPRPEEVSRELHRMLAQGSVADTARLYEEEALFIELDGVVRGRSQIVAAHQRFVNAGLKVRLVDSTTFVTGDLALVHWSWVVESGGGDTMEGVSAEVLRRQPDGSWLFVIDNSDGAAMLGRT